MLQEAGFDPSYAEAYEDESRDDSIKAKMAEGLNLVGEDVGTPIIGFESDEGDVGVLSAAWSRATKHSPYGMQYAHSPTQKASGS